MCLESGHIHAPRPEISDERHQCRRHRWCRIQHMHVPCRHNQIRDANERGHSQHGQPICSPYDLCAIRSPGLLPWCDADCASCDAGECGSVLFVRKRPCILSRSICCATVNLPVGSENWSLCRDDSVIQYFNFLKCPFDNRNRQRNVIFLLHLFFSDGYL
jgi:hypothetical protein